MDRWEYFGSALLDGETVLYKQNDIRLYDGDSRSNFDGGNINITSHRLIWKDSKVTIQLLLEKVIHVESEEGGFMRSDKISVHLSPETDRFNDRPVDSSKNNYIKLSFRDGGQSEGFKQLQDALAKKKWVAPAPRAAPKNPPMREIRSGIGGIEKNMSAKNKIDQGNISAAFSDLTKLMEMAKPMVGLAKSISSKIRAKEGEITEDETIRFKSMLMSLGVDDPITKDSAGSDKKYYHGLAKEMFLILDQPIQVAGGMITLTDAFCRVNRARGLELISPEDLLNACKALKDTQLPMSLHTFDTGVMVLQTASHSQEEILHSTTNLVESTGSLTADEPSKTLNLSVILAKERLLSAEGAGKVCRDDSVQGLRFYPNQFLTRED